MDARTDSLGHWDTRNDIQSQVARNETGSAPVQFDDWQLLPGRRGAGGRCHERMRLEVFLNRAE